MNIEEINKYYYRVFAMIPNKSDKPLSSIAYRIAAILIKELDFYQPRKLPKRKELIDMLNVSHQSVIDALAQLEDVGFIIRTNEIARIIRGDEIEQNKSTEYFNQVFKKERVKKRFNDEFYLNFNYNLRTDEIIFEVCKKYIEANPKLVAVYEYISKLSDEIIKRELMDKIINDFCMGIETVISEKYSDYKIDTNIIKNILNSTTL